VIPSRQDSVLKEQVMTCKQTLVTTIGASVLAAMFTASSAWAQTEKTLYRFATGDGAYPNAQVVADSAGNFYGTTSFGGPTNDGTVFELSPPATPGLPWTQTVLHTFSRSDGGAPFGGVIFDSAGNLYGTTFVGGLYDYGTVFELSPPSAPGGAWTHTVLYNFSGSPDAGQPVDTLIFDQAGNLYGTTEYDGYNGFCCGTVFELSPPSAPGGAWTEKILYIFGGNTDGSEPVGGVVFDAAGNLYGTTYAGGQGGNCTSSCGIVFKLSPPTAPGGAWTETVLHRFKGRGDGLSPLAGLIPYRGFLYGTTWAGGTGNTGTVFQMSPTTGEKKVIYNFTDLAGDGGGPASALVVDKAGNLYGTTTVGGRNDRGTIFKLTPPAQGGGAWTETVLYSFSGQGDGNQPVAPLMIRNGVLYGTTTAGGDLTCSVGYGPGCGTVFRLAP
jgi:uncharacterized repeat protein (TIGR03803 family)